MTIGSLFSGIGGLELGLEWAGLGPVLWQVEKDEKCRNCLATHWPDAKRYEDVCTVGKNELEPVDLICGGFPCQDVSSAGKRAGLAGARSGLWFEFARIIGELRPQCVVVENVGSGAEKWVDAVRRSLEQFGYASLPVPLAASDVGAWHRRERIFIVAYACSFGKRESDTDTDTIRHCEQAREASFSGSSLSPYPNGDLLRLKRWGGARSSGQEARELETGTSDSDDSRELREAAGRQQGRHWTCDEHIWTAEPDVARMVHGLPFRAHRQRALGNSVVPQCAEVIGHVVRLLNGM